MNNLLFEKIVYKFVSICIVLPVFRFLFRGHLVGAHNIPKNDSFIIVSNHGSLLDPPFLGHALGTKVSFMAKEELFRIPFLSSVIKACGAYPVKRGIADRNSINVAANKLLNHEAIGIFIDGTRQKNGIVNKPKKGAALIAFKTKKLLLPVAIINSHRLLKFKGFIPIFNRVTIKVGEPINYPNSGSKKDIEITTLQLKNKINFLIG
mgnify:CR=1 FL=1|tara:strand:+ start:2162 stop:2782 length:621 start_codon:yes stop_codon:yes gene_type:complete